MREVLLSTAVKHQSRAIAQSTNCETQKQGRAIACVADKRNEWEGLWIGANMPVANRIVRPPCPLSRSRPALSLTLEARVPHGHTQLLARAAGVPAPDAPAAQLAVGGSALAPPRTHFRSHWCACPGRTQQHNWLLVGLPWLHHTLSHWVLVHLPWVAPSTTHSHTTQHHAWWALQQ